MLRFPSILREISFLLLLIGGLGAILYYFLTRYPEQMGLILLIPLALAALFLYFFHFPLFVRAMVLFTPLSVSFKDLGDGVGMSLPNEAMLMGVGLASIVIAFRSGILSRRFLLHPITLVIGVQLLWIVVTAFYSLETEVSIKFLIVRLLYVWVFYVFFQVFFTDLKKMTEFLLLYSVGFIPVMFYAMIGLGSHGFIQGYSPAMIDPFYDDHTVFGACLAMLVPVWWLIYRNKSLDEEIPPWLRNVFPFFIAFFIFCLIFSYSRAAWLSMILVAGVFFAYRFRLGASLILAFVVVVVTTVVVFKEPIYDRMAQNSLGSNTSLLGHATSIADLEKDQSNLERVNRWASAVRMWKERPMMGFGPGSYERHYGGYQVTSQMTNISTMDGDRGDAHSEYLVALSEQGLMGMILIMLLFGMTFSTGLRIAFRAADPKVRLFALGITLGLFTYYFHGAVNSFLDIDKAALLFWTYTGIVVALDIHFPKSKPNLRKNIQGN